MKGIELLKRDSFLNKIYLKEISELKQRLLQEKEESHKLKVELELAKGEISELKDQIDYLKRSGGNEGDVGIESEVEKQPFDEETHNARNESEVSAGLLLDRGNEGYAMEEERRSESSALAGDYISNSDVVVETQFPGSLAPEMTESITPKRKHVEHFPIPEAPMCKVRKLDSCTARPHTCGEKCVSELPKEVKMLINSMGNLKPILNPCATRAHTRSMEREKTSSKPHTRSLDKRKETSYSSWKTCYCCEMTEFRTRKRKQVENISTSDAPSMSTSRSKVPKL